MTRLTTRINPVSRYFQDKTWTDSQGKSWGIRSSMTPQHAANTYRYLVRNSSAVTKRSYIGYLLELQDDAFTHGDEAEVLSITSLISDLRNVDSVIWLKATPLMQALADRGDINPDTVDGSARVVRPGGLTGQLVLGNYDGEPVRTRLALGRG